MKKIKLLLAFAMIFGVSSLFAQTNYSDYSYSQRDNLFYDSFNDNYNNWSTSNGYMEGGVYKWTAPETGLASAIKLLHVDTSKDFEIEGKFKYISSPKDDMLQSLVWGCDQTNRMNYFGFTPDGSFRVSKYENNDYTAYKDWDKSTAISKYGWNKMTIRKVGSTMYFFINETKIHSMPFKPFFGDHMGFQAATGATLHIDYIRVSYLTKNPSSYDYVSYSDRTNAFYDSFNDNGNSWSTGTSGLSTGYMVDGNYHWQVLSDETGYVAHHETDIDDSRDWEIETKIKYHSGETSNTIMFSWGKGEQNAYSIAYNPDGKYWIGQYEDGGYTAYKDWTFTTAIKKYNYNKFTIRKIGSTCYYFINEQLMHSAPFHAFYGNKYGFFASKGNNAIRADYLRISYLDKKTEFDKEVIAYNTPPTITITEPSNVASRGFDVVEAKSIRVAGKAVDSDGIYKVAVNGVSATVDADGGFYAYVVLSTGNNNISVVATDNKMKKATNNFKLDYKEKEVVNPVAKGEKRLALVIGNGTYSNAGTLKNPTNDARSMKIALEKLGFKVLKYENCSQTTMKKAIDDFGRQLVGYDVGLFFYAGHGLQVDGSNYLVPTDAVIQNEDEVEYDCVRADRIMAKMEGAETKTNLVVLDACRNNPFERSWNRSGGGKGLAFMNAPVGSLIAYATSPGNTASDGSGSNGLYTESLLSELDKPNVNIMEMFQKVRGKVIEKSGGSQVPWESTSLRGNFYFMKK
ncbi:MAG: hypothetical protein ACJAWV_003265 [Flammeovirgaceae bacterium]|jgi:hypothetical protein